jgi:cobalt-zinc-cadmium resistance protein CzcA
MLDSTVRAAIANRFLVVLAVIGLCIGAALMLPKLNLDAFPDVTNIQVTVNTEARGLAAAEVEQLVTFPVESSMYSLPDVEEVRSISSTGLSIVTIVFKEGTDIYFAREQVFQ